MEKQDTLLANLHRERPREVPKVRRQGRWDHRADIGGENDTSSGIDDYALVEVEMGRMTSRGDRIGMVGGIEIMLEMELIEKYGNIKMTIHLYKGRSNPKAYFEGRRR